MSRVRWVFAKRVCGDELCCNERVLVETQMEDTAMGLFGEIQRLMVDRELEKLEETERWVEKRGRRSVVTKG